MKATITAAIVAALVAGGGSAVAASYIDGRSIRPHSIPLNRLAARPAAGVHLNYVAYALCANGTAKVAS